MSNKKLARKIGQLLVVGFNGKAITPEIKELIHGYHVGSIILFSRNIGEPEEVLQLTSSLQKEAKAAGYEKPLFICLDPGERGRQQNESRDDNLSRGNGTWCDRGTTACL